MMGNIRVERLQGKSCLIFINIIQDECLTEKVYPNTYHLQSIANSIDNLGLLNPGLMKTSIIKDIQGDNILSSQTRGAFDTLTKVSKDLYIASGWAILPERKEPSDSVILTYENNHGPRLFAVVDRRSERNDVARALKDSSYSNSGWQKTFSSTGFPEGAVKISAWAFDANTGKAFKLNGTHTIKTASANVTIPGVKNIQEITFKVAPNSANGFSMAHLMILVE